MAKVPEKSLQDAIKSHSKNGELFGKKKKTFFQLCIDIFQLWLVK